MSGYSRGAARERQVKERLEAQGWIVVRGAGSKGFDLLALKEGHQPMVVEVKATARSPWAGFGPAERAKFCETATKAGARARYCWWPAGRQPRWYERQDIEAMEDVVDVTRTTPID